MYCSRCGTWRPDSSPCSTCGHAEGDALAAPVLLAPRYAGFWRRFLAWLLDTVLLILMHQLVRALLGLPAFRAPDANLDTPETLTDLSSLFFSWLYRTLLESSAAQATIGQRMLDLRVTDLEGRRIGFARANGRHFASYVSVCTLGIGYLMQLWTARRQTLHDKLSGCVVVVGHEASPSIGVSS